MKITTYLFIAALLSLLGINSVYSQTPLTRAQELLELTRKGEGDSIHVRMNDNIRKMISPQVFSDTFSKLEKQFGKYRSHGEWETDSAAGMTIYYTDVQFEKYELRFIVAFDDNGLANTIRFAPAPFKNIKSAVQMNEDKVGEAEMTIVSGAYKLPGTLTYPKGKTNVPVVILVHGSGPSDRDATLGPNKPFRDIAWGLAERGIAVIRYDKRTYVYGDKSAPDIARLTFDDETVDDALAAIQWAESRKLINNEAIYVAGHSMGAMLAPRIAERSGKLAGIILIAGNARPMEDLLPEQMTYLASLQDSSDTMKAQIEELRKQVANVKKIGTDQFDSSIDLPLGIQIAYWEFSNKYKQVDVAEKLNIPIFIVQGERDYQVTMQDFGIWRFELRRKPNVTFKSYPKLNHILQEGSGKSTPFEYNHPGPVPAYFIDDMAGFVNKQK